MWMMIFEGVWLSVMSISDIRYRRIPLWMIGFGLPVVIIAFTAEWRSGSFYLPEILFSLAPGFLLLLAAFTKKAGYGDGFVFTLLGLMDRDKNDMRIFLMSLIFMSLFSVVMLVLRRVKRETRLPYLPFLLIAWITGRVLL